MEDASEHKEQAKIERVFRLISLLKGRRRTVPQLASAINTSPRSLYRYLKLLEKLGYLLDCDEQNRYWIFEAETSKVVFTVEETALLRPLLASLKNTSPLHASIERKIYLTSELIPLAEELLDRRKGMMVTKLNQAIQERRQVNLLRYHSPHSNSTSDRLVEPLSFTDDFATLNAYEIGSKTIKSFKVNRIDEVELLDSLQVNDGVVNTFRVNPPREACNNLFSRFLPEINFLLARTSKWLTKMLLADRGSVHLRN